MKDSGNFIALYNSLIVAAVVALVGAIIALKASVAVLQASDMSQNKRLDRLEEPRFRETNGKP